MSNELAWNPTKLVLGERFEKKVSYKLSEK